MLRFSVDGCLSGEMFLRPVEYEAIRETQAMSNDHRDTI